MRKARSKLMISYIPVEYRLYTTEELCFILQMSRKRLYNLRCLKPSLYRASYRLGALGSEIRYSESDLRRIIDSMLVIPD